MADAKPAGCARPTGGVLGGTGPSSQDREELTPAKENPPMISVGKPAPDFLSPAFHKGQFTQVKLSDHLGKWIVLCFYPGDFTFV
jgi:hypothetical protein